MRKQKIKEEVTLAEVYIRYKGKKIWVNEFMRLILKGKTTEEALKKSVCR